MIYNINEKSGIHPRIKSKILRIIKGINLLFVLKVSLCNSKAILGHQRQSCHYWQYLVNIYFNTYLFSSLTPTKKQKAKQKANIYIFYNELT